MGLAELLWTAGHLGVRAVADGIRNRKLPQQNPFGSHGAEGCPACDVHRELAEAERLMFGVLRAWQGSEPAPAYRRAEVLLVRGDLESARDKLRGVQKQKPEVLEALGGLRECIETALPLLPDRQDTERPRWQRAYEAVLRCWEMADSFADAWFRPTPASPARDDELVARVRRLPPEDRERLREILGD